MKLTHAFGTRISDRQTFQFIGQYRSYCQSDTTKLTLDWSTVEWADVLSLLVLGSTLASYKSKTLAIRIDLGSADDSTIGHRIFLKFLADQGFLDAYSKFSEFALSTFDDDIRRTTIRTVTSLRAIKDLSLSFPGPTNLRGADCIHAKIVPIQELKTHSAAFDQFIDTLMQEARVRLRDAAFGNNPYIRDRILQKLRKILFELTLNIVEHAYRSIPSGHAAIYVRVRTRRPTNRSAMREWDSVWNAEQNEALVATSAQIDTNADWLEIFVCDAGDGLLSHLKEWKLAFKDPEIDTIVDRALRSKRRLFSIGHQLFRMPLSRLSREANGRPHFTGLQFLGYMLGLDEDSCRIYTEGQWLGARHPWPVGIEQGSRELTAASPPSIAPGTSFAIVLQPPEQQTTYPANAWILPTDHNLRQIASSLRSAGNDQPDSLVIDRRELDDQSPPSAVTTLNSQLPQSIMIFRPRRSLTKNTLAKWIENFAGLFARSPVWNFDVLIIAELTPSQAIILADTITHFSASPDSERTIYMVSEDFSVCCLSKQSNERRFVFDRKRATAFLTNPPHPGIPTASALALHLRTLDSTIFWSRVQSRDCINSFLDGTIHWTNDVILSGYLDLAIALSDPLAYRACRRSLRRVLQLFPQHKAVKTDDLISSLTADVTGGAYRPRQPSDEQTVLPIGSIAVTSTTINKQLERLTDNGTDAVVLFVHRDAPIRQSSRRPLAAMSWIPTSTERTRREPHYYRIPNTPFVAEGGEKSIPIVRFRPSDDAGTAFESPFYPRNPTQTYSDFLQHRALKLGHWDYGGRHDLLSINLSQIVEFSVLERSPLLSWLRNELEDLCSQACSDTAPSFLLVYPSHEVTDKIIQIVSTDPDFERIRIAARIIPIKFIGSHSVSPLLVSPSIIAAIRSELSSTDNSRTSVLLDDATVSGKHLRELTQILREAGSERVHTIALLDRTGLPVREGVMDDFFRRHRRYWRWDVPTMGHGRECILCAAIRRVQAMAEQPLLPPYKKRLREWITEWRSTNIADGWHNNGLTPVQLHSPISVAFGLGGDSSSPTRNEVRHTISTSLAAIVVELSRLTTKADTALSKTVKLDAERTTSPERSTLYTQAIIEIICSQLILFFDELTYWQKLDRYLALLRVVWTTSTADRATSLAGLSFALIDDELSHKLWQQCSSTLFDSVIFGNTDAILCAQIITSRAHISKSKTAVGVAQLTEAARQNSLMLSNSESYRRTIVNIFTVIGFRGGASHETDLLSYLSQLSKPLPKAESTIPASEARRLLTALLGALEFLSDLILASNTHYSAPDVRRDCESIRALINQLDDHHRGDRGYLLDWATAARVVVFGNGDRASLAYRYQTYFFRKISPNLPVASFLQPEIDELYSGWRRIFTEKRRQGGIAGCFAEANSGVEPIVHCATSDDMQFNGEAFFDGTIRDAIRDILTNVVHSSGPIGNPWREGPVTAHMWWHATIDSDSGFLCIEFANGAVDPHFRLKSTAATAGVFRIGGTYNMSTEQKGFGTLVVLSVKIPLSGTLVREM